MHRIAIRTVAVTAMLMLSAFALEVQASDDELVVEGLPPGWLHQRAVRAYTRKQLAIRDSIVRVAQSQIGVPYVLGGASPEFGFDCSGLVLWVMSQVALQTPRTARQQARLGMPVETERLRPGDLLTFGDRGDESHVGIYIGDGRFVHASSVARRVVVSRLDRPRYERVKPYAGARRVLVTAAIERSRM